MSPTFDVVFSLLVPEPELVTSKWTIQEAIEKHLQPLFDDLNDIFSFSVKSQVLYLTELSLDPKQV